MKAHLQSHYNLIGQNLLRYRTAKGLSQQELSILSNVDRSQISRLEHGQIECYHSTLIDLADALEVDIHEIVPPTLNREFR